MKKSPNEFTDLVWSHYREHKRTMPWRTEPTPYYVIVSEIMLQQTQVDRVIPKFNSFIKKFPNWQSLASSSTSTLLQEWSGLGYNRRALYLKRIAEAITSKPEFSFLKSGIQKKSESFAVETPQIIFTRKVSRTEDIALQDNVRSRKQSFQIFSDNHMLTMYNSLLKLPGIGPNTAGSIMAFAFNIPQPFIETNIRSVYIDYFFKNSKKKISDVDLFPLIEKTIDTKNPREWYYALMDFGSYLKRSKTNPSRRSTHHIKQKTFRGSNRELRSNILKLILAKPQSEKAILNSFKASTFKKEAILQNIIDLEKEGFIIRRKNALLIVT